MKEFLDTNIILDFLLKWEPFVEETKDIFQFTSEKLFESYTSSTSITNIYYIISKIENKNKALEKTKGLLTIINVLNVGSTTISKAINSKFKDFEDGVQNFSALENEIQIIVTRNVKDFKESKLHILSPKEFINLIS